MKRTSVFRRALAVLLALAAALTLLGCGGGGGGTKQAAKPMTIDDLQKLCEEELIHDGGTSDSWPNDDGYFYVYEPFGLLGYGDGALMAQADKDQVVQTVIAVDDELDPEYFAAIDKDALEEFLKVVDEEDTEAYNTVEIEAWAFFCDCATLVEKLSNIETAEAYAVVLTAIDSIVEENNWEYSFNIEEEQVAFVATCSED